MKSRSMSWAGHMTCTKKREAYRVLVRTLKGEEPLKVNSHIACRAHAASMPFPYHAVPLRV